MRELTAAWAGLVEAKNPWKYLDTSDRKPFKHLDFRLDTKGASGNIEAYEVVALHKGDTVGRLSFSHFTDQGSVKTGMLAVPLEHQGRDVASELMLWLWHWCQDRNLSLEHSDRTDEGELWWRHFHKEHPRVAALIIRAEIVSEPDSPLRYDYLGRPKRLAIYDPGAGPGTHRYFYTDEQLAKTKGKGKNEDIARGAQPGLVAFVDYITSANETFIAYVAVRPDQRGRGLARKLVQALYDRYYDDQRYFNWGKVMAEEAGHLAEDFKARYPKTMFKRWW